MPACNQSWGGVWAREVGSGHDTTCKHINQFARNHNTYPWPCQDITHRYHKHDPVYTYTTISLAPPTHIPTLYNDNFQKPWSNLHLHPHYRHSDILHTDTAVSVLAPPAPTTYYPYTTLPLHHTAPTPHCPYTTLPLHHTAPTPHWPYTTLALHQTALTPHCPYTTLPLHHTIASYPGPSPLKKQTNRKGSGDTWQYFPYVLSQQSWFWVDESHSSINWCMKECTHLITLLLHSLVTTWQRLPANCHR